MKIQTNPNCGHRNQYSELLRVFQREVAIIAGPEVLRHLAYVEISDDLQSLEWLDGRKILRIPSELSSVALTGELIHSLRFNPKVLDRADTLRQRVLQSLDEVGVAWTSRRLETRSALLRRRRAKLRRIEALTLEIQEIDALLEQTPAPHHPQRRARQKSEPRHHSP